MIPSPGQNFGTSETLFLYPKRSRFFLLAVGALLFVCAGIFIGSDHDSGIPRLVTVLISSLAIGFFGLCFLYAVYRLLVHRPALILNREGIVDNASAVSAGLVRWEEIERIYCSSVQRQLFISIAVKDPDRFLQGMPGVKAKLMRLNIGLVGAPINLPATPMGLSVTELLKLIQNFRESRGL
jgi:hypothetical protein